MTLKVLPVFLLLSLTGIAQPAAEEGGPVHGAPLYSDAIAGPSEVPEHIGLLADTLAIVNQIHGPYVGFHGKVSQQYTNFTKLCELACTDELLQLTEHDNAVVRGYAFWALSRQQFDGLDSVLLAHARDEELVREFHGGIVNRVPLIDFMQWVVNPDLFDGESRKLDQDVFQRLSDIRFSDER